MRASQVEHEMRRRQNEPAQAPRGGDGGDEGNDSEALPTLEADNHDLPAMSAKAWAAIEAANARWPQMFRYGGVLARVLDGAAEQVRIDPLDKGALRHHLARVARWTRAAGEAGRVPALPPAWLVDDLMAEPRPPLPVLNRLVTAPVFSSSGEILTRPGYHEAALTYYVPAPGFEVPEVPSRPSPEEVALARDLWLELVVDFPFLC
jgi:hypothetical protein